MTVVIVCHSVDGSSCLANSESRIVHRTTIGGLSAQAVNINEIVKPKRQTPVVAFVLIGGP
jgi:hypothetical protein